MKATKLLHDLGQSIWLDNITRDLLETGTLGRYIDELSVTGLTSMPTCTSTLKFGVRPQSVPTQRQPVPSPAPEQFSLF